MPLLHPLFHGRFTLFSNISHFITKKTVRPVLDIAEIVNLQRLQRCRSRGYVGKVG
jgi:hypothetical protein